MQRKKLETDEFWDGKKIRFCMGVMFLKAWNYVAKHEHSFALPLLIHYSAIDKVRSSAAEILCQIYRHKEQAI